MEFRHELGRGGAERFGRAFGHGIDRLRGTLGVLAERRGEGRRGLADFSDDAAAGAAEFRDEVAAGSHQRLGGFVRHVAELLRHVLGAVGDDFREMAGGAVEGRDQFGLLVADQVADAAAGFVNRASDRGRGLGDVDGEALMGGLDGGADALGRRHDGFTFGCQFGDERAHLVFVVGVGAFERGHLAMDEVLQFAGARHRALDAIANRGNFAPHGLTEREDGLRSSNFRLREASGDFGHHAGGNLQLARTALQSGHREKEQHGHDDRERGDDERCLDAGAEHTISSENEAIRTRENEPCAGKPERREQEREHQRPLGCGARKRLK